MDMFKMLGKMNEVQGKMKAAKEAIAKTTLQETEMGLITVEITGDKRILSIKTAPAFYENHTIEEREAMLTEVTNNAIQKAEAYSKEYMADAMKDVIPNIPGMDLGGMLGGW